MLTRDQAASLLTLVRELRNAAWKAGFEAARTTGRPGHSEDARRRELEMDAQVEQWITAHTEQPAPTNSDWEYWKQRAMEDVDLDSLPDRTRASILFVRRTLGIPA